MEEENTNLAKVEGDNFTEGVDEAELNEQSKEYFSAKPKEEVIELCVDLGNELEGLLSLIILMREADEKQSGEYEKWKKELYTKVEDLMVEE